MKFWIDENVPRPLGKAVKTAGYDTYIAQQRSRAEIAAGKYITLG